MRGGRLSTATTGEAGRLQDRRATKGGQSGNTSRSNLNTGRRRYDRTGGTNSSALLCHMKPIAQIAHLPAKDFYEWIEYCNGRAKPLSRTGAPPPATAFVEFWIGNESWGCRPLHGGRYSPNSAAHRRRATALISNTSPGPNGGDQLDARFFNSMVEGREPVELGLRGAALLQHASARITTENGKGSRVRPHGIADRADWAVMGEATSIA